MCAIEWVFIVPFSDINRFNLHHVWRYTAVRIMDILNYILDFSRADFVKVNNKYGYFICFHSHSTSKPTD